MSKLNKSISLETAYTDYTLTEIIGAGGAGQVYGGTSNSGNLVAVKLLTNNVSSDTRKRFKNETHFLLNNKHPNIVKVSEYGVAHIGKTHGPFYVMERYDGNLRSAFSGPRNNERTLHLFSKILDGVEAAHLVGSVHRDLKPENILYMAQGERLAVADFGAALFSENERATAIETAAGKRIANFEYSAPEQKRPGNAAGAPADIFALGLILHELFTGVVPHGNGYTLIESVAPDFSFLDQVVGKMLNHDPARRYQTIAQVKSDIETHRSDLINRQRLDELSKTVVSADEITDPLALISPKVVKVHWNSGRLYFTLDKPVNDAWINAFNNMGGYQSIMGAGPAEFQWRDNVASVRDDGDGATQQIIDLFKGWLPAATETYRRNFEQHLQKIERERRKAKDAERAALERSIRINSGLNF